MVSKDMPAPLTSCLDVGRHIPFRPFFMEALWIGGRSLEGRGTNCDPAVVPSFGLSTRSDSQSLQFPICPVDAECLLTLGRKGVGAFSLSSSELVKYSL